MPLPRRDRFFRRFVFLGLIVMTQSYTLFRHDDVFLQEHYAGKFSYRANPSADTKLRNTRLADPTGSSNTVRRSSISATGCPL